MGLRGAGLVFRFALTVFIAKFLDLESLGFASFLFAAVVAAPGLLSFGLHYQLNRNIIGRPLEEAGPRLRDRLALDAILVITAAVVVGALALGGQLQAVRHGLATSIALAAFLLIAMELISTDIHLGLISLGQSTVANAFLFFRSSSWAPLFIGAAFLFADLRSLSALLAFWLCGFAFGFGYLGRALKGWPWRAIMHKPTDFPWLLRDLRRSLMVYTSDVSVLLAQYADRAIIGALLGVREAGIYFFYWSLAAGVGQLIYTSVVQVSLPRMAQAWGRQSPGEFVALLRSNLLRALAWSAFLGVACTAFVTFLVPHLNEPAIAASLHFLPILLLGAAFKIGGDLLAQALYVIGRDHAVAALKYVSAGGALIFTFACIAAFGLDGAPVAMAANAVSVFLSCAWVLKQALKP
jgi:O-antigen/teichoic acid export membrane protein